MFCKNCGSELSANAKFCHVCGEQIINEMPANGLQKSFYPLMQQEKQIEPCVTQEQQPRKKKKSGKKVKKIVISVVAALFAVALAVTGSLLIPDYIERKKLEKQSQIIEEIRLQYSLGNYDEARALVPELPTIKGVYRDRYKNCDKVILRVIDFGEKLSTWEGTDYELLDEIEYFLRDVKTMGISGGYYFIASLSCKDTYDVTDYYLNTAIPALREELDLVAELKEIMSEYANGYYKYVYDIHNLFYNSSYSKSEAIAIDEGITDAYDTAVDALGELDNRYPDSRLIESCLEIVEENNKSYNEYLKSYFYNVNFSGGYRTLSREYAENTREKIIKHINIQVNTCMMKESLENAFSVSYMDCTFTTVYDDEISEEYRGLVSTDYAIVRIALTLNGGREIKFSEGGVNKTFGSMISSIASNYAPAN